MRHVPLFRYAALATLAAAACAGAQADEFYGGMYAHPLVGGASSRQDVRKATVESRGDLRRQSPRYDVERDYPPNLAVMGAAPAEPRTLTRDEVRRETMRAMRNGTIPKGEAIGYPYAR
jgi:hypothetical protein